MINLRGIFLNIDRTTDGVPRTKSALNHHDHHRRHRHHHYRHRHHNCILGSVETILALMQNALVSEQLAQTIHAGAKELAEQMSERNKALQDADNTLAEQVCK